MVSRWGVNQTAAEVSLGPPTSTISQSPSRQSFRGSHRRGATSGSSSVRVGRRKSTCEAVGGGPSSCPCQGQSPSFGGANHCVQEFRRTSKEKGDSGGGRHLQSPRTEGGVRDGSAGRRSAIAAIGGIALCSRVSHRVSTQNRRLDTRTRLSDTTTPKILPRVWMADGPPVVESIPPIPMSSVQDIEGWLSNRNCELKNA